MITCATNCRRRGVALPIAFLALNLVTGMVTSISTMNQGLKSQVLHSSNNQWSFLLAYSAMSRLVAKIHAGTSRLYFRRITFNDDLLDVSNRFIVEFSKAGEPDDFPATAGPSRFSKLVDDLLAEWAANQNKSDEIAVTLGPVATAKQALEQLGGRQPPPFTKSYPSIPGDTLFPNRPAPTAPIPTDAPMFDLNQQGWAIKDTAKLANDKCINGKDVAGQGKGGNRAEANPILNEAEEARYKAMAGMRQLTRGRLTW